MKRIEIEKKLHAAGVTLGDRIIVTERLTNRQMSGTLVLYSSHSLRLEDSGRRYTVGYNEIGNVEPANAN